MATARKSDVSSEMLFRRLLVAAGPLTLFVFFFPQFKRSFLLAVFCEELILA